MKNKRGEMGIGVIIVLAIAIIIGLILLQPIATNVEQGTRAATGAVVTVNYSVGAGAVGTTSELVGQELVTLTGVVNATSGVAIPAVNYSVAECIRTSDNLKGICYKRLGTTDANAIQAQPVKISYSYYPNGYIDDGGARSIAGLIVLLVAIAILVIVLQPSMRESIGI